MFDAATSKKDIYLKIPSNLESTSVTLISPQRKAVGNIVSPIKKVIISFLFISPKNM